MACHRMNSDGLPQYHLRRIGRRPSLPNVTNFINFNKRVTLIGRNSEVVDYVLSSANESRKKTISRTHARVIRCPSSNHHRLVDSSFTGVYVNDRRLDGDVILSEGDTVTFGHPQSSRVDRGERARQPNSEFHFMFELCDCKRGQGPEQGHEPRPCSAPPVQPLSILPAACPRLPAPQFLPRALPSFAPGQLLAAAETGSGVVALRGLGEPTTGAEVREQLAPMPGLVWLPYPPSGPEWTEWAGRSPASTDPGARSPAASGAPPQSPVTPMQPPLVNGGVPAGHGSADGTYLDSRTEERSLFPPVPLALWNECLSGATEGPVSGEAEPSKRQLPSERWEAPASPSGRDGPAGARAVTDRRRAPVPVPRDRWQRSKHPGETRVAAAAFWPEGGVGLPGGVSTSAAPRRNAVPAGAGTGTARDQAQGNSAGVARCGEPVAEVDWAPPMDEEPPEDTGAGGVTKATEAAEPPLGLGVTGQLKQRQGEDMWTELTVHGSTFTQEVPTVLGVDSARSSVGSASSVGDDRGDPASSDWQAVGNEFHLRDEDRQSKGGDLVTDSVCSAARWRDSAAQPSLGDTGETPLPHSERRRGAARTSSEGTLVEGNSASERSLCAQTLEILEDPDKRLEDVCVSRDVPGQHLSPEGRFENGTVAEVESEENGGLHGGPQTLLGNAVCAEGVLPILTDVGLTAWNGQPIEANLDDHHLIEAQATADTVTECTGTAGNGRELSSAGEGQLLSDDSHARATVVDELEASTVLSLRTETSNSLPEDTSSALTEQLGKAGSLINSATREGFESLVESQVAPKLEAVSVGQSEWIKERGDGSSFVEAPAAASDTPWVTSTTLDDSVPKADSSTFASETKPESELAVELARDVDGFPVTTLSTFGPSVPGVTSRDSKWPGILPRNLCSPLVGPEQGAQGQVGTAGQPTEGDCARAMPGDAVGALGHSENHGKTPRASSKVDVEDTKAQDELNLTDQREQEMETDGVQEMETDGVQEMETDGVQEMEMGGQRDDLRCGGKLLPLEGMTCQNVVMESEITTLGRVGFDTCLVVANVSLKPCDPHGEETDSDTEEASVMLQPSPRADAEEAGDSIEKDTNTQVDPVPECAGGDMDVASVNPIAVAQSATSPGVGMVTSSSSLVCHVINKPISPEPTAAAGDYMETQQEVSPPERAEAHSELALTHPLAVPPSLGECAEAEPRGGEEVGEGLLPECPALTREEGDEAVGRLTPAGGPVAALVKLGTTVGPECRTGSYAAGSPPSVTSWTRTAPSPPTQTESRSQAATGGAVEQSRSERSASEQPFRGVPRGVAAGLQAEDLRFPVKPQESESLPRGGEVSDPARAGVPPEGQKAEDNPVSVPDAGEGLSKVDGEPTEERYLVSGYLTTRTMPGATAELGGHREDFTDTGKTELSSNSLEDRGMFPLSQDCGPDVSTPAETSKSEMTEGGDRELRSAQWTCPGALGVSDTGDLSSGPLGGCGQAMEPETGGNPLTAVGTVPLGCWTTTEVWQCRVGGLVALRCPGRVLARENIVDDKGEPRSSEGPTDSEGGSNTPTSPGPSVSEWGADAPVPQGPSVSVGGADTPVPQGPSVSVGGADAPVPQAPTVSRVGAGISMCPHPTVPTQGTYTPTWQGSTVTEGGADILTLEDPTVPEGPTNITSVWVPTLSERGANMLTSQGPAVAEGGADVAEGGADTTAPQGPTEGGTDVTEGGADTTAPQGPTEGGTDITEGGADTTAPKGPTVAEGGTDVTEGGTDVTEGGADATAPQGPTEGGTDITEGGADTTAPQGPTVAEGGTDVTEGGTDVTEGGADATAPQGPTEGGTDVTEGGADTTAPQGPTVAEGGVDVAAPQGPTEGGSDVTAPQGPPITEGGTDTTAPQGPPITEGGADVTAPQGPTEGGTDVTEGGADTTAPQGPTEGAANASALQDPAARMEGRLGEEAPVAASHRGGGGAPWNRALLGGETLLHEGPLAVTAAEATTAEQRPATGDPEGRGAVVPDELLLASESQLLSAARPGGGLEWSGAGDRELPPGEAGGSLAAGFTSQLEQSAATAQEARRVGVNESQGSGGSRFPSGFVEMGNSAELAGGRPAGPRDLQRAELQGDAARGSSPGAKRDGEWPGEEALGLIDAVIGRLQRQGRDHLEAPAPAGVEQGAASAGMEQEDGGQGGSGHLFDECWPVEGNELPARDDSSNPGALETELRCVCPADPDTQEERGLRCPVTPSAIALTSAQEASEVGSTGKALTGGGEEPIPGGSDNQGLVGERHQETKEPPAPERSSGPSPPWASGRQEEPRWPPSGSDSQRPGLWGCTKAVPPLALEAERAEGWQGEGLDERSGLVTDTGVSAGLGSPCETGQEAGEGSIDVSCCNGWFLSTQVPDNSMNDVSGSEQGEGLSTRADGVAPITEPNQIVTEVVTSSSTDPAVGAGADLGQTLTAEEPAGHSFVAKEIQMDTCPQTEFPKATSVSVEEPVEGLQFEDRRSEENGDSGPALVPRESDHLEEQPGFSKEAEVGPRGFAREGRARELCGVGEFGRGMEMGAGATEGTLGENRVCVSSQLASQIVKQDNGAIKTPLYSPNLARNSRETDKNLQQQLVLENPDEDPSKGCRAPTAGDQPNSGKVDTCVLEQEGRVIKCKWLSEGKEPLFPEAPIAEVFRGEPTDVSVDSGWPGVELETMEGSHRDLGRSEVEAASGINVELGLMADSTDTKLSPGCLSLQLPGSKSEEEGVAGSWRSNGSRHLGTRALKRPHASEVADLNSTAAGPSKRRCTPQQSGAVGLQPQEGIKLNLRSFSKQLSQHRATYIGRLVRQFFAEYRPSWKCRVPKLAVVDRRDEVARIVEEFCKTLGTESEANAVVKLQQSATSSGTGQWSTCWGSELGQESQEDHASSPLEVSQNREVQLSRPCSTGQGLALPRATDGTRVSEAAECSLPVCHSSSAISWRGRDVGDLCTFPLPEGSDVAQQSEAIQESSRDTTSDLLRRSPHFGQNTGDVQREGDSATDGFDHPFCFTQDTRAYTEKAEAPSTHEMGPLSLPQCSSVAESPEEPGHDRCSEYQSLTPRGTSSDVGGTEEMACDGRESLLLEIPNTSCSSTLVESVKEARTDWRSSSPPAQRSAASAEDGVAAVLSDGRSSSDASAHLPAPCWDIRPPNLADSGQVVEELSPLDHSHLEQRCEGMDGHSVVQPSAPGVDGVNAAQLGCSNSQPDDGAEPSVLDYSKMDCNDSSVESISVAEPSALDYNKMGGSDDESESDNIAELSALDYNSHNCSINKIEPINIMEPSAPHHRSPYQSDSKISLSIAEPLTPDNIDWDWSDDEVEPVSIAEPSALDNSGLCLSDNEVEPVCAPESLAVDNNARSLSEDEVESVNIAEPPAPDDNDLGCSGDEIEPVGATESSALDDNSLDQSEHEVEPVNITEPPALDNDAPGHGDHQIEPVNVERRLLHCNNPRHSNAKIECVDVAKQSALGLSNLGRNDNGVASVNGAELSALVHNTLTSVTGGESAAPLGHCAEWRDIPNRLPGAGCCTAPRGAPTDCVDPWQSHGEGSVWELSDSTRPDQAGAVGCVSGREHQSSLAESLCLPASRLSAPEVKNPLRAASQNAIVKDPAWRETWSQLRLESGLRVGRTSPGETPHQEMPRDSVAHRGRAGIDWRARGGFGSGSRGAWGAAGESLAAGGVSSVPFAAGVKTEGGCDPTDGTGCSSSPVSLPSSLPRATDCSAAPARNLCLDLRSDSPLLMDPWPVGGEQPARQVAEATRLGAGGTKDVDPYSRLSTPGGPNTPACPPPAPAEQSLALPTRRRVGESRARAGDVGCKRDGASLSSGNRLKAIKMESRSDGEAGDSAHGHWLGVTNPSPVSGCPPTTSGAGSCLTEPTAGFSQPSAASRCPTLPTDPVSWRSSERHAARTPPEGPAVGFPGLRNATPPHAEVPHPQPSRSPSAQPRVKATAALPSGPLGQRSPAPSLDQSPRAGPCRVRLPCQHLPRFLDNEMSLPLAEGECPGDLDPENSRDYTLRGLSPGSPGSDMAGLPPGRDSGSGQAESCPPRSKRGPWNPARRDGTVGAGPRSEGTGEGPPRSSFLERRGEKSEETGRPSEADAAFVPRSAEHCWASSDQDIGFQLRECSLLLQSIAEVLQAEGVAEKHVSEWRQTIKELEEQTVPPLTYVAVVGDTGSGKSSLLNALLDEEGVLPTSAMRACTAVVVEVSHNNSSCHYRADVEFFSEEEWNKELLSLLSDMTDKRGRLKRRRPDPGSEASVAYSRVKAVYGKILPYSELRQLREVTQYLGTTMTISQAQASEFRCRVQPFVDSRNDSTNSRGGEFWPIVKRVRVQVPNSAVLQTGAVLVDLPGIGDSNAARNSVAKEYLKTCDAVWIVANVTRAVDDKTAKETLDESLRRQLLMDGHFGSIAFICTKTDSHNVTEIMSALAMNDTCSPLEAEIARLRDQIEQRQVDRKAWKSDLEREQSNNQNGERAKQLELAIKQLDMELTDLHHEKSVKQRELSLNSIRARNFFCKQKIQLNFNRGLQDLKRQARAEDTDSDEEQEESEDEDEDVHEVHPLVTEGSGPDPHLDSQLPVFTVSSTEYLKLRDKLQRDGPPRVFHNIEDTEIPAVQRFVHRITLARRALGTEVVIRKLATFVSHIVNYLTNRRAQSASDQAKVREAVQDCLSRVREIFQQAAEDCSRDIENSFTIIKTHLNMGKKAAMRICEDTVLHWGSQPPIGFRYATYKATCSRNGTFSSPACGSVDFNEELSCPLLTHLQVVWNKEFSISVPQHLMRFKTAVLEKLEYFFNDLLQRIRRIEGDIQPINYILSQQLSAVRAKLENFAITLLNDITARQRIISRILTPSVQVEMIPAYSKCSSESGARCFDRMKSHMERYIHDHKEPIFTATCRKLMDQLDLLKQEIHSRLKHFLDEICRELLVQFEPLLKPLRIIDEIIPRLDSICRRTTAVCERSQIDFTLPKIEENDEEPEPEPATFLRTPEEAGTPPLQELEKFLGKVKIMKINQEDVNPTDPIEISLDEVVLKYEVPVSYTRRKEPIPFRLLSSCEFSTGIPFLILTHRTKHKGRGRTDVVVLDEEQTPPVFGQWMQAAADRWRSQLEFRRLEVLPGVHRLRSLQVIYQGSETKVPMEEATSSVWPGSYEDSSTSSPCGYADGFPRSRKRGWWETERPGALPVHQGRWEQLSRETQTQPPVLKKEKGDWWDPGPSQDRTDRSGPPALERERHRHPAEDDSDSE